MRRKELFYYVTSGSNVTRDVHWCVTVDYQQIANGKIANQIHGFTIDYGKFILISDIPQFWLGNIRLRDVLRPIARERKDLMDYKWQYFTACN